MIDLKAKQQATPLLAPLTFASPLLLLTLPMRRAAVQVFRAARRPVLRKASRARLSISEINHALGWRALSSQRERRASLKLLNSSMRFPTLAFGAALAAGGGYYLYNSQNTSSQPAGASPVAPGQQTRSLTTSASPVQTSEEVARRALLLDQGGQLFSGTIAGDGPLSKETDDYGRKVLEMMTPDQATQRLRRNEESWLVGRGKGVVRYDVVQLPSNDPIEDDHAENIITVPEDLLPPSDGQTSNDWMFWGVFDGHSGWTTSAKLRQALITFVARELNNTYKSAINNPSPFPTAESIDAAIKQGFLRLDNEIVHDSVAKVNKAKSKRVAAELLAPALSGSCALLSFYDSQSKLLRVACTGDSRAVLGRRGASGKWTATALSVDQTGATESEAQRMRAEHPGEPNVVHNGRVLGGLEPTRAFGDAIYKWSIETQEKIKQTYFGRTPSKLLRTPPYVTAEPVVTTTKVDPEKGDFVVMATDGLWEMLTNEEVVGLVGMWLDEQAKHSKKAGANSSNSWLASWYQQKGLPVEKPGEKKGSSPKGNNDGGQRVPVRVQQWGVTGTESERFLVQDKNAATHLVRNALGGKDHDQVCALLTLPAPYARRYRDDLTVEVIFFGQGEDTGAVTPNKDASASFEKAAKL